MDSDHEDQRIETISWSEMELFCQDVLADEIPNDKA